MPLQPVRGSYAFDLTVDQNLRSGIFQPMRPFDYFTGGPISTREKITIVEDGGELEILNGFETDIELILVNRNGKVFEAVDVGSGQKKKLYRKESAPVVTEYPALVGAGDENSFMLDSFVTPMHIGSFIGERDHYAVRFAGEPQWVDSGINSSKRIKDRHILFGVF